MRCPDCNSWMQNGICLICLEDYYNKKDINKNKPGENNEKNKLEK